MKAFIPIESNPGVFTELAHRLGLSNVLSFHDMLSIEDDELLASVSRPALALILLFPASIGYQERLKEDMKLVPDYEKCGEEEEAMWYNQTIYNACGLYALLHAVCNGDARDFIVPDSCLSRLISTCKPLSVHDRATALENETELESIYASMAVRGNTEAPSNPEDEVDFHYVCFVKSHKNGHLYEMDGDLKGPVDRGYLGPDKDVLSATALGVVKEYMQRKQEDEQFSLLVLGPG